MDEVMMGAQCFWQTEDVWQTKWPLV